MSKDHDKTAGSAPEAPEIADMIERERVRLARTLDALAELEEKTLAAGRKATKFDAKFIKLVSNIAWTAERRAKIVGELRQLEKHDRVMSRTPEQRFRLVKAYLRMEATPLQRAEVTELLAELETARVVS